MKEISKKTANMQIFFIKKTGEKYNVPSFWIGELKTPQA